MSKRDSSYLEGLKHESNLDKKRMRMIKLVRNGGKKLTYHELLLMRNLVNKGFLSVKKSPTNKLQLSITRKGKYFLSPTIAAAEEVTTKQ